MRINAQFIDAATGNHIWADRFDKPMADLFDMQDEIVSRLANQLRGELIAAEAERAEHEPESRRSRLLFPRRRRFQQRPPGKHRASEGAVRKGAQAQSGAYRRHRGGGARRCLLGALFAAGGARRAARGGGGELFKALSIDPRSHWAHLWLGYVQIMTNRAARGIGEFERALSFNRNRRRPCLDRPRQGHAGTSGGDGSPYRRGVSHLANRRRQRLCGNTLTAWPSCISGADQEAAELFRKSIDTSRNFPLNHFHNAAALAHLGRQSEAEAEIKAGLDGADLHPGAVSRRARKATIPSFWASANA